MSISVLNVAPTAVVLVVSGVCVWPYLWGPDEGSDGPKAAPPPELSAALFEPAVGTKFERNPFQDMAAVRLAQARIAFGRIKDKVIASLAKRGVAGEEGKHEPAGEDEPDVLAKVVLNATYLHPDRQLAMINGRIYALGEVLKGISASQGRYVLAEVRPHSVVISVGGKRQELSYPAPTAQPRDLSARSANVVTAGRNKVEGAASRRPPQRKAALAAGAGPRRTQGRGR